METKTEKEKFDLAMTKGQDRASVDDLFFLFSAAPPPHHQLFLATLECKVKCFVLCFGPRFGLYLFVVGESIREYVTRSI